MSDDSERSDESAEAGPPDWSSAGPDRYRHLLEPPVPGPGQEVLDMRGYTEVTELVCESFGRLDPRSWAASIGWAISCTGICFGDGNTDTNERLDRQQDVVTALAYLVQMLLVAAEDGVGLRDRVVETYIDEVLPGLRNEPFGLVAAPSVICAQMKDLEDQLDQLDELEETEGVEFIVPGLVLTDARIRGFFEQEWLKTANEATWEPDDAEISSFIEGDLGDPPADAAD